MAFRTVFRTQAAFGTTSRVTGGCRKAGTSSLKKVTGRIFTITSVRDFTEESRNYIMEFLNKRQLKNCENQHCFDFTFKKYSSRDTIPLSSKNCFDVRLKQIVSCKFL
jgi:hypothetical protein